MITQMTFSLISSLRRYEIGQGIYSLSAFGVL